MIFSPNKVLYKAKVFWIKSWLAKSHWRQVAVVSLSGFAMAVSSFSGTPTNSYNNSAQHGFVTLIPKIKVGSLYQDAKDQVWAGTTDWGVFVSQDGKKFSRLPVLGLTTEVSAVFQDTHQTTWASTNPGVSYSEDGVHFSSMPQFDNFYVMNIFQDSNGNLWFGTYLNGLYYSADGKHFTHLPAANNQLVHKVYQDKKGSIWCATTNGLYKSNGSTNLKKVQNFSPMPKYMPEFFNIFEGKAGTYWASTTDGLYYSLDGTNFHLVTISNYGWVETVSQDTFGNTWFATKLHGIFVASKDSATFHALPKSSGITPVPPSAFNTYSSYLGHDKTFWMSVNGTIYASADSKHFTLMNPNQNVSQVFQILQDRRNTTVYFATRMGLYGTKFTQHKLNCY